MTKDTASSSHPALDAKDAVAIAIAFVRSIHNEDTEISVEEVDFDSQKEEWLITVGWWRFFPDPPGTSTSDNIFSNRKLERVYRVVRVNPSTGKALSMKIRPVPGT